MKGNSFWFSLCMRFYVIAGWLLFAACTYTQQQNNSDSTGAMIAATPQKDTTPTDTLNHSSISPQQVVDYAKTLIGIPYKYASTDPLQGFDCSGFITYVFNHFGMQVPRSSYEFTNAYPEVAVATAKQGDLVLFTGTDSTDTAVGHMGIIVSSVNDSINFIHSTSGKANGVTITPLNAYYKSRFVKIVRVLPQNDLPE